MFHKLAWNFIVVTLSKISYKTNPLQTMPKAHALTKWIAIMLQNCSFHRGRNCFQYDTLHSIELAAQSFTSTIFNLKQKTVKHTDVFSAALGPVVIINNYYYLLLLCYQHPTQMLKIEQPSSARFSWDLVIFSREKKILIQGICHNSLPIPSHRR